MTNCHDHQIQLASNKTFKLSNCFIVMYNCYLFYVNRNCVKLYPFELVELVEY